MLQARLHNLKLALSVVRKNQTNQEPRVWAELEKEVIDLQSRIKETECQIKTNSVET